LLHGQTNGFRSSMTVSSYRLDLRNGSPPV
jgi:hypothetical protein